MGTSDLFEVLKLFLQATQVLTTLWVASRKVRRKGRPRLK
jgi:hypothetical protein